MSGWLELIVKAGRHPLRLVATLAAAFALVLGFAGNAALVGLSLGVLGGLAAGEILGRSPLRLPVALGGLATALLGGVALSALIVHVPAVSSVLGPTGALRASAFILYGIVSVGIVGSLRAVAARYHAWQAVELAACSAAFASAFASHRGGSVARPLWLSDWAWNAGFDPAVALLAFGGVFVALLALLLLLESRQRLSLASALFLPLAAILAIVFIDVKDLQQDQEASELARITEGQGEAPAGGLRNDPRDQPQGQPPSDQPQGQPPSGQPQGQPPSGQPQGQPPRDELEGPSPRDDLEGQPPSNPAPGPPQRDEDQGEGQGEGRREEEGKNDKAQPVAVVLLGDDYSPPSGGFYLRGEVQSEFNGTRLVATTRADVDLDVLGHYPARPEPVKEVPSEQDRVRIRARVAMLVEHEQPFALETPTLYLPMDNPNPSRFVAAYRFESLAQVSDYDLLLGRAATNPAWSDEVREYYLRIPEDERYVALAEHLVEALPVEARDDPFAKALSIKVFLDRESRYSTREKHAGVQDPTADYLFGNRTGYCVHFAHAAAYLNRAVGVPARIGTGYLVSEQDRRGSTLLVRSGDAHAWPEVYLDGIGWIVLDITPAENLDEPPQPLDEDLAKLLGEWAREKPREQPAIARDWSALRRFLLQATVAMAALLVASLLALHWIAKGWRRVSPILAPGRALPRVGYRLALDYLAEVGLSRGPGETRAAFARRVEPVAPSFTHLTAMHLAVQLGDPGKVTHGRPEVSREAWRLGLSTLRRELRRSTRSWRRLAGRLDPTSLYRSR
jgi:transglutaminase-like putative cysteine protease